MNSFQQTRIIRHCVELKDSELMAIPLIEIQVTRSLSSASWVAWLFAALVASICLSL